MSASEEKYRVWITRPAGQAGALLEALRAEGIEALHLPLLEIEALPHSREMTERVLELDQYDLAFFVSSNAARLGMEYVEGYWPQYPAHIRNYALGPTTARMLESFGVRAVYPDSAVDTETLFTMPALRDDLAAITGKEARALIFRGVGGREKLAENLRRLAVRVDYLELYRRRQPDYSESFLQDCLQQGVPDAVLISSADALTNFCSLFASSPSALHDFRLIVSSPRLDQLAREAGFTQVVRVKGADDISIMRGLEALRAGTLPDTGETKHE